MPLFEIDRPRTLGYQFGGSRFLPLFLADLPRVRLVLRFLKAEENFKIGELIDFSEDRQEIKAENDYPKLVSEGWGAVYFKKGRCGFQIPPISTLIDFRLLILF